MPTLIQQIETIKLQVNNNLSLINGTRESGFLYSFYDNSARYGCFVNNPSDDKKTLVIDDADAGTVNPDKQEPPLRPEEYANIAIVYGEVFMISNNNSMDIVLDDTDFPSAGFTRNDIVYLYVGDSGPATDIALGAASSGSPVDATIPKGGYAIARVVVTDLGAIQIDDLRNFESTSVAGKADKSVPSSVGNIALLDANGNLADSGVKPIGRNILINASFDSDKVINQRGFDGNWGGLSDGTYGYDRWKRQDASNITQIIEAGAFKTDSSYVLSGSGVVTAQLTSPTSGDWTVTVVNTANNIQLELGSEATPFEIVDKAIQLTKCQRYFYALGTLTSTDRRHAFATAYRNATSRYFAIPCPVQMRVNPSPGIIGSPTINFSADGVNTVIGTSNLIIVRNDSAALACYINNIPSTSAVVIGIISFVINGNTNNFTFDAEIY